MKRKTGKEMSKPRRLTAGKREIKDFPKLPSATSFTRKMLGDIPKMQIG